jgi:hypothetical protein
MTKVVINLMFISESDLYFLAAMEPNGPAIKLVNVAERKTAGERKLNHLTIYLKPFEVEARRVFLQPRRRLVNRRC